MKATLNFTTNEEAEKFALAYSRKTLKGHTIFNKQVTVYNLTEKEILFINTYVDQLNK